MKRTEKEQLVSELNDKIKGAKAFYYTDFTGLNVKHMTELRRRFRRAGVEYVVIKNTLALRSVKEIGLTGQALKGPTGIVIGKDPVAAAKVLAEFAKENEQRPTVKGGMLDGKPINVAQVKQLAQMPSRDQMLSRDPGRPATSPLAAFAGAMTGMLAMTVGVFEALQAEARGSELIPRRIA